MHLVKLEGVGVGRQGVPASGPHPTELDQMHP
jgi:hypothetical protein